MYERQISPPDMADRPMKKFLDWIADRFCSAEWRTYRGGGELQMRRRVNGRWEYRKPTPEELDEAIQWQAIK